MAQTKRLYRTVNDKVIAGVAGGLAEYFDVDVIIFRLLFVLLVLFGGGGLLAYIIMWIVTPPKPISLNFDNSSSTTQPGAGQNANADNAANPETNPVAAKNSGPSNASLVAGIILIGIGTLFLINRVIPWVNLGNFWPVILIIGGFLIIDPNILKSKNR